MELNEKVTAMVKKVQEINNKKLDEDMISKGQLSIRSAKFRC